ncbi:ubiquinone/menaquinone biosynthesis methyltransferase [bacterium]|nr:ubiquinone/menaquinone biosynthesis methyltransferase [bacterium]
MNKNPKNIQKMFDNISSIYDITNNIISLGLHKYIKKIAIKSCGDIKGKVLDLCTGTGDIASLLNDKCDVTGLDFSTKMLEIALKKYPNIPFVEGDCTNLPFEDNSFDAVTISFGLRNIENYHLALDEIFRILKPDGYFFHLDFGKSNILINSIFKYITLFATSFLYKNNNAYKYLINSKEKFFNKNELISIFERHNLKLVKEKSFILGIISFQLCQKKINN